MKIDTDEIISPSAANQNFSNAMKIADRRGKNIDETAVMEMTDDEKIDFVASRILREHKAAFLELVK